MKTCSKCKISKEITEYYKNTKLKSGLYSHCKACECLKKAKWRANNQDKIKQYNIDNKEQIKKNHDKWLVNNKKRIQQWRKEYYSTYNDVNKDTINAYKRKYIANRKLNDPMYKLSHNLRSLIRCSLYTQGYGKKSKTADLLGADFDTVLNYFKDLWFKRYGMELPKKFEIHHIIPNHTATTEEELIRLQHYTNLEPLTKEDHCLIHNPK